MTITKINSQAGRRGVQALVLVDPGPLAKLLGDSEGPAHEDWDTSAERPDREWKTWKGRVKFVRGIVDSLVELLTPTTVEPDFDLLSDYFSLERMGGSQRRRESGTEEKKPGVMDSVLSQPTWFRISERTGGFTIGRNSDVPLPRGASLRVTVAYDLSIGDPVKKWNEVDFRIGKDAGMLLPKGTGAFINVEKGNVVRLSNIHESFRCSVEGFDEHRDLFIRADEITEPEGDTA